MRIKGSRKGGMKVVCRECGANVYHVSSGLICDECQAKIRPVAHVFAQSYLPLDWSDVGKITQRSRLSVSGYQLESLQEQNDRLAEHGERQNPLFEME